MAGYVDPLLSQSQIPNSAPLEDAADRFLTPCRHPPGNRHPQPPRCDCLAERERPLQVFVRHELLGTAIQDPSGVVSDGTE